MGPLPGGFEGRSPACWHIGLEEPAYSLQSTVLVAWLLFGVSVIRKLAQPLGPGPLATRESAQNK